MPTGAVQGPLWGARVRDWAELIEAVNVGYFDAIFDVVGLATGTRLLDVGCSAGLAAKRAHERGALASGLDASEAMIAYARSQLPEGDFRVGEMEALPYADDAFDLVTSGNAFQYASNPIAALREARRVVRPGGHVAMVVWGRREACQSSGVMGAIASVLPAPPAGAAGPFALSVPGKIEGMMTEAGLLPTTAGNVVLTYEWPDVETAARAYLASGNAARAIQLVGEEAVRTAIGPALAPLTTESGGVRASNEFHYVIARKET
jgi:SAM-dependent methyltransferase